jgi:hypothetical protein
LRVVSAGDAVFVASRRRLPGGAVMQEFDQLKQLVTEVEEDVKKAEGGNKAAGTRVRKYMQDIKDAAQEVRKKVLEVRAVQE